MQIEDLVRDLSPSVRYLADKGIRCIRCGEPIWGTLEEAAKAKCFSDDQIQQIVDELNSTI